MMYIISKDKRRFTFLSQETEYHRKMIAHCLNNGWMVEYVELNAF